jgi:hypothetical protein
MTLVAGRGPLSSDPAGRFSPPIPTNVVFIEPHARRVQALLDGRLVIDTEQVLMVHRRGHPLTYVFPADEVGDLPSSFTTRRIRTIALTAVPPSVVCASRSTTPCW